MKIAAGLVGALVASCANVGRAEFCEMPSSFFDFGFPQAFVPFNGKLSLFGTGISAGEIEIAGSVDVDVASVPTSGTSANITFNSMDFSNLSFVFDNVRFEPFNSQAGNNACRLCNFNSVMPPRGIKPCPFNTNVLLLLDGDDSTAAGQAVKYLAKRILDLFDISLSRSEAAIMQYVTATQQPLVKAEFTQNLSSSELRTIIDNIVDFKASSIYVDEGLNAAYDLIATSGSKTNRNLVVLVTDGINGVGLDPATIAQAVDAIRSLPNAEFIIVASDGSEDTLRGIAQCLDQGPCKSVIKTNEITSAAADRAIIEFNKVACFPPSKKDLLNIKESVSLFTFAVRDDQNELTKSRMENIARNIIKSTSEQYNIDPSKIQLLETKSIPQDETRSNVRKLQMIDTESLFGDMGFLQIGLLNEALGTDPTSFASAISQQLGDRESILSSALRENSPANISLDNFEVRPIKKVIDSTSVNTNSVLPTGLLENLNMRQSFSDLLSANEFLTVPEGFDGNLPGLDGNLPGLDGNLPGLDGNLPGMDLLEGFF